jgi:hypothetical protein
MKSPFNLSESEASPTSKFVKLWEVESVVEQLEQVVRRSRNEQKKLSSLESSLGFREKLTEVVKTTYLGEKGVTETVKRLVFAAAEQGIKSGKAVAPLNGLDEVQIQALRRLQPFFFEAGITLGIPQASQIKDAGVVIQFHKLLEEVIGPDSAPKR